MGSSDMQPWQVSVVFWVLFVVAFLRGLRLVEALVFVRAQSSLLLRFSCLRLSSGLSCEVGSRLVPNG